MGTATPPQGGRNLGLGCLAVAAVLGLVAVGLLLLTGRVTSAIGRALTDPGGATVTHSVVVEQTRAVARLVSSETILRDVVVYQHRRLGSTKRALVVVSGKVLAGFDLDRGNEVQVDHDARRIRIVLPPAAILAVEITELKTYDEQRGLWNPFRPADRDTVFLLARRQLAETAAELDLAAHAETSARQLLQAMVSAEGYTTEVAFSPTPAGAGVPAEQRE